MTDTLPKKRAESTSELNRTIRTLVQLIPFGIGAALDVQIFGRLADRQRERTTAFVESIDQRVAELAENRPGFVKTEFFDTDEFRFILTEILTRVAREHREEKINCYRAALINSMCVDPRTDFDRKAYFLDILDSLTVDQLRILNRFNDEGSRTNRRGDMSLGAIGTHLNAVDDTAKRYVHSSVELLASRRLLDAGPVPFRQEPREMIRLPSDYRNQPIPKFVDYRTVLQDHQWFSISPLGIEFMRFVSEPSCVENAGDQ